MSEAIQHIIFDHLETLTTPFRHDEAVTILLPPCPLHGLQAIPSLHNYRRN